MISGVVSVALVTVIAAALFVFKQRQKRSTVRKGSKDYANIYSTSGGGDELDTLIANTGSQKLWDKFQVHWILER